MDITITFEPTSRADWRAWLEKNHAAAQEIWVLYDRSSGKITYLDIVEEALCFGWIDGIAKRTEDGRAAQRLTPRRARSNWTELNKERVRRLIAAGKMTSAGRNVLPDLTLRDLVIAPDILAALKADPEVWRLFQSFPDMYRRIRIGYIEEARKQKPEFAKRLQSFLEKTGQGKMFGNWDDSKMPRTPPVAPAKRQKRG